MARTPSARYPAAAHIGGGTFRHALQLYARAGAVPRRRAAFSRRPVTDHTRQADHGDYRRHRHGIVAAPQRRSRLAAFTCPKRSVAAVSETRNSASCARSWGVRSRVFPYLSSAVLASRALRHGATPDEQATLLPRLVSGAATGDAGVDGRPALVGLRGYRAVRAHRRRCLAAGWSQDARARWRHGRLRRRRRAR